MQFPLRKFIAFITLLFVLGQSVAIAFHNHAADHVHEPAKSCAVCQVAPTSKATLSAPVTPTTPTFIFSQNFNISFISETIAFVSHIPPARAPPLV